MKNVFKVLCIVVTVLISSNLVGQYGVSSGSYAMARSNSQISHQDVYVEDFINYHKHQITIPETEDVAITIDYDTSILNSKDEFILQVGLATQEIKHRKKRNTVNVNMVLDRSGSMSGSKIALVKKAMITFVKSLSPEDYFSLVQFDSKAQVVIKNHQIGNDLSRIIRQIEGIHSGGSTNLSSGIIKGYKEAEKQNSNRVNSRVIVLTDGMTNEGETDLEKLLQLSKNYTKKGIEISTIGVGSSLDFNLLKQLALDGNGSNHFIGEHEEEIQKVFVDEAQSLLYQIGKEPMVTITLPNTFKIVDFYGYQPIYDGDNKIRVPLENLNAGSTQVLLLKVKSKAKKGKIAVKLDYINSEKEKEHFVLNNTYTSSSSTLNKEVSKNYHLGYMATHYKKAIKEYENSNFGIVKSIVEKTKLEVNKYNYNDVDIDRLLALFDKFPTENHAIVNRY